MEAFQCCRIYNEVSFGSMPQGKVVSHGSRLFGAVQGSLRGRIDLTRDPAGNASPSPNGESKRESWKSVRSISDMVTAGFMLARESEKVAKEIDLVLNRIVPW